MMTIAVLGIDLGKNVCSLVGLDEPMFPPKLAMGRKRLSAALSRRSFKKIVGTPPSAWHRCARV
jgi:hypothetical protein